MLDEPTNHLDADSIVWLRDFLKAFSGGIVVISHDTDLLESTVNRVLHLDANRAVIDTYNVGWKAYLQQRETDEKRRKRERSNAEAKAKTLTDQANKMRAKATKAQAAQSMLKRAEKMMAGIEGERAVDKVARIAFPEPAPFNPRMTTREPLSMARSTSVNTSSDPYDLESSAAVRGVLPHGAGLGKAIRATLSA